VAYFILLIFVLSGIILVVPFVIEQMADIVALLINKINVFQELLQEKGLAEVILASGLPTSIKTNLAQSISESNWM